MINILITAIGGRSHGEQILKALQLSGEGRYRIYGADANPHCPQFGLVEASAVLPLASSPEYLAALINIIDKHKINVLFHGCEPELRVFSVNRDLIVARNVFLPINPADVIELCMDKEKTNSRLDELGFQPPRHRVASSRDQLDNIDWFPVVIKPSIGGGGSAHVYIAQNKRELDGLSEYLDIGNNKQKFIVQEYVGTPQDEYTVGVLHDMDGEYINSIALRRAFSSQLSVRAIAANHTNRNELGPRLLVSSGISQGEIGHFPEVTEQCSEIAKSLGVRGPVNIQCRLVDGIVKVFEINPRFSGTTSLRAMMGYNEPDLLIRKHVEGALIPRAFSYDYGIITRALLETRIT